MKMTMKIPNNYYDIATRWVSEFNANGTYIYTLDEDITLLCLEICQRSIAKNPATKIIIVIDCYATRSAVVNTLNKNNIPTTNYTALSADYIRHDVNYRYNIAIYVNLKTVAGVRAVASRTKYGLFIMNNAIGNDKYSAADKAEVYKLFPPMNSAKITDITSIISPVEEHRIMLGFTKAGDKEKYEEYTDYITGCLNIFGSFETMEFARNGNKYTGESAEQVRLGIAAYNGWSDKLDPNNPFDKEVDSYFNPTSLEERANTAYNIMRERKNLLTDNYSKFDAILDLLNNQLKGKKVLIVSKRGEFAAAITECLLENGIACGDYHDAAAPKAIIDERTGDYVRYKSGNNKGEIRLYKAQALSNLNVERFNLDANSCDLSDFQKSTLLYVLSMKNRSYTGLECSVDAVIFTTPFNDTIDEFRYRYNGIHFNTDKAVFYKLYLAGTIEEKELNKEKNSPMHEIVKNDNQQNFFVADDC